MTYKRIKILDTFIHIIGNIIKHKHIQKYMKLTFLNNNRLRYEQNRE